MWTILSGAPPASHGQLHSGLLLLRVFTGLVLAYGAQDNVFSAEHLLEFRDFLAKHGFPAPLLSAYISAYAQFVGGLLLAAGWFTRPAAAVMVVNFIVALVMVHRSLPFGLNIAPMAMCANSLVLVITGPGAFSLDGWLGRRRRGYRARL